MINTSLLLLLLLGCAITLFQVIASPTTPFLNSRIFTDNANDNLQPDSLSNIYLNYGSMSVASGKLTLFYASCNPDSSKQETSVQHITIGSTKVTKEFQPTKFVWSVPSNIQTGGCIYATDSTGHILAQSEPYTILPSNSKFVKRGHPELFEGMYFDAVKFHKSQMTKRNKIHASDKSESKYIHIIVNPSLYIYLYI